MAESRTGVGGGETKGETCARKKVLKKKKDKTKNPPLMLLCQRDVE